ncbi:TPA: DUF1833 family protein [Photobacterium damselae]
MKAIEVVYASAPVDDIPIHTLELLDEIALKNGEPDAIIRLCQGFYEPNSEGEEGIVLGLEDGSKAFFRSSAFGCSLPPKSVKGKQNLKFQIDNVTGEARHFIDRALSLGSKVKVTYRVYTSSYLHEPAQPPLVLTAISEKDNHQTVGVVASFRDLVNKAWPKRRYTTSVTPGLKYQGS